MRHELIAAHLGEHGEAAAVVIGIETDRGPWAQALPLPIACIVTHSGKQRQRERTEPPIWLGPACLLLGIDLVSRRA